MKTHEINIRDPFVLPYENTYYMCGTRGATCWGEADGFDAYTSRDLENWEGPYEMFHRPPDFWADRNFWAPEIHIYRDAFYLFASFKAKGHARGTQLLKASHPLGPYAPHSSGPVTPAAWECLDGTLYVDASGKPFMVFCHEWVQATDGGMYAMPLSEDLTQAAGEPFLLFHASQPGFTMPHDGQSSFVTDGPFCYRTKSEDLLLLWSSFGKSGYLQAIARSKSGEIQGPWMHEASPLYEKDGGHGMLFTAPDNTLYLALHTPNETPYERPVFLKVTESGDQLTIA